MKQLMIALCLMFSFGAFAQLTTLEQDKIVEGVAKNDRREMWRMGMSDVSSHVEKPTKLMIDEFVAGNEQIESPLNRDDIAAIYRCLHTPKYCVVYTIDLYGEMYGGSGHSRRWVLLNPVTGKHRSFLHAVYEE
jgi:hypothetical protein